MTWTKGRRLSTYTHNGTTYTFTYDGEGQRKTKTFGGTTVRYVYVDGKLLKELQTVNGEEKEILYQYDETGVIGFLYNGYQYYYRKNAQGDILSVHCGTDLHAMYTYDAWGNCTISFDAAGIGALNPFRYRGYYLDRETGLYYLMTRYYDPEIGRFVNANSLARLNPKALNGCNLYAYCGENPVNHSQITGTAFINANSLSNAVTINNLKENISNLEGNTFKARNWLYGHITSISYTKEKGNINLLGALNLTYSQTISYANREKTLFYSFLDENRSTTSIGVGINLGNYLGVEAGFSAGFTDWSFILTEKNSPFDMNASVQITPWFNINASLGLGGLKAGFSIQIDGVSHDFSAHLTPLGLFIAILAYFGVEIPVPASI